jgi:copper transport protein
VVAGSVLNAITVEAALLVAVLVATGFLVDRNPEGDAPPASTAVASEPGVRTATLGDIEVRATLTPLTTGPNTVTIQLRSPTGEPTEGVAPPVVRLSSDRVVLGAVPLTPGEAGTYTGTVVLPAPGTWRMQVSLRVSKFANPVAELEFVVAGG